MKLEHAAGVARAAGAPVDVVALLVAQAASLRATVADARPLGARLDAAAARVAKAERGAQATAAAVEAATAADEAARADLAVARAAHDEVRSLAAAAAEPVAPAPPPRRADSEPPCSGPRSRSRGRRPQREDPMGR